LLFAFLLVLSLRPASAQRPSNANAYYQELRGLLPGSDVITVENFELHRDAATFTFRRGDFAFYGDVNGKVTGAVFKGDGHFHIKPVSAEERHNLSILNHSEEFDEDFNQVILRFTDGTAAELHKAATGKGQPENSYAEAARDFHNYQRLKLLENIDLRLLQDVLSPAPGGYFFAAIRGKKNGHLFFRIDPNGVPDVAPEEVSLLSVNDWGPTFLTASHLAAEGDHPNNNEENATTRIDHEDLDVTIEKSGFLTGMATVHLIALQDGVAVVPFNVYPTLRVSRVETDKGEQLDFVQEKKEEDADFGLVLAHPLKKGESSTVRIAYGGKDVVFNAGGSNYYPVARESWYPNGAQGLGDYATYNMTFHVPKGLQLIATGTKQKESTDGKTTTTEWVTPVPMPTVGFNLGDFAMKEAIVEQKNSDNLVVDAYANKQLPDSLKQLNEAMNGTSGVPGSGLDETREGTLGNISTVSMLPVELSQGQVAARLYTSYFGQLPFPAISLTQQTACNYGQSWPMLVYLPICGFLDQTQQHTLGLLEGDPMYWKIVTPHEVAHQWWGQTVGFRSYRDQWMSEGFADTSASIFLQVTRPKPDDFREFWKEQRKLITEKNAFGFRPIDVGPVTMGIRLVAPKTGYNIYQDLVYPKGAYILHMIRMMMWTPKEGDARFIATMHDLVTTYRLKAATTEDFKAIVEKHMSPGMDLDGNQRMDWYFREYVYGMDLPAYHFEQQISPNGDSQSLHFKLTQSGVDAQFRMLVPIYLELENGKIMRLGAASIIGDTTVDKSFNLPKMESPVKRASINYYYDVLSTEN
jgi:hypothetical protein